MTSRMADTPTVTDPSAFAKKSLGIQVVLSVVTLGLYTVYWLYSTAKQLDQGTDASLMPILAIIPVVNIVTTWQISKASEAVTNRGPSWCSCSSSWSRPSPGTGCSPG